MTDISAVESSFGRCCTKDEFWKAFYDRFLESSPEIAPMFAETDFEKQRGLIRAGVNFVLIYAKNAENSLAKTKLNSIGVTHDKAHYNVRPDMYPLWEDSIIATIREMDPKFDDALEQEWRAAIKPALELLKSHY